MRLDNLSQIENIAKQVNFSIFELPSGTDFNKIFEKSYHINVPQDKKEIPIENIRQITEITSNKQNDALYIVIEEADKMSLSATNAFLKALEEPGEHIHYIFLTNNASAILPTVKSRANNYYLINDNKISDPPKANLEIFKLAKEYISASPSQLPAIVEKIHKFNKDDNRGTAIAVVDCSIELMYKSYLMRGNPSFLTKLEKLIQTKDALQNNGHIKLQLIANMV